MMNDNLLWKGLRRKDPDRPRPLADSVLRMIWQEKRISRVDIAQKGNLSRSTVSEIVKEILPMGLVKEVGEGPSRGGRRPIVLEFQDDACVILGIEIGGAHVAVALTDLRGKILIWKSRNHPVRTDPPGTRKLIAALCKECLADPTIPQRPLVGIGIGAPSPIDPAQPNRLSSIILPAWDEHLGLDELGEYYGVPLFVDNDANLGALAEYWWGSGRGVGDIAYIKVATGIGSGHIINGEIYRGATGVAGEIGHVAIDPSGKTCVCGLKGCLVTLAGGHALEDRATELAPDYPDSSLSGKKITAKDIEQAALAGDPLALIVTHEAAEYLGTAVAGLLNLMNPAKVIMGGDFARLGELVLAPLRHRVLSRTLVNSVAAVEIVASELGLHSVALGASTLVLKETLSDSRLFPAIKTTASPAKKAR
jgi:glucokinase-like ROK family protein